MGGSLKDDSLQGKVITKDLIVNAKDMFNLKKEGSIVIHFDSFFAFHFVTIFKCLNCLYEGQTLRPLLPKPAVTPLKEGQLLVGGLRIKQVTRIGSSDKVCVYFQLFFQSNSIKLILVKIKQNSLIIYRQS